MFIDLINQISDPTHWTDILYLAIAYIVSAIIGDYFILKISNTAYKNILGELQNKRVLAKTTSRWVGIIERLIITTSIIFEVPEALVIWYGIKVISKLELWGGERKNDKDKEKEGINEQKTGLGRSLFNVYLLGTELSLVYGGLGAQVFLWLKNGEIFFPIISIITMIVFSWFLIIKMKQIKK